MKTGPGTAHRHKTKSALWYDQTDIGSGSTHTHDVDVSKYDKAAADLSALTARVAALEAPSPVPTVPSAPITVTTNNVTIEDRSFTAAPGFGTGIHAAGSLGSRISNLTIRRCTFSGFTYAVFPEYVDNLTIEDCVIEDATIAGIEAISCIAGSVSRNAVRRIGVGQAPGWNAYGITLTARPGEPACQDIAVDGNLIEDVPTWIGLNLHTASLRCDLTNNTTRRVRRPIFIAAITPQRIVNCRISGNRIESAGAVTVGEAGIFVNLTDGCSIVDNFISADYPHPADDADWRNYVWDQGNTSTALVRSGNVLI